MPCKIPWGTLPYHKSLEYTTCDVPSGKKNPNERNADFLNRYNFLCDSPTFRQDANASLWGRPGKGKKKILFYLEGIFKFKVCPLFLFLFYFLIY